MSLGPARRAVVIGAGLMGSDIVSIFLKAGWVVDVIEPNSEIWEAARARMVLACSDLGGAFEPGALKWQVSATQVNWEQVEIVVECVPEDLALKRRVFAQLDTVVPRDILIGSNSSGLPISEIARDCKTAERMVNAHFFLPAHLVPLVELAKGAHTSLDTLKRMRDIFSSVGRVPVQINQDLPGFLANRIQHALMREAFSLIDRGLATPEDVDSAVRFGFGFRYVAAGPILQKELSGLETQLAASTAIYPSLCNDSAPSAGLAALVAEGRLGAKTLHGYWPWTVDALERTHKEFQRVLREAGKLLSNSYPTRTGV